MYTVNKRCWEDYLPTLKTFNAHDKSFCFVFLHFFVPWESAQLVNLADGRDGGWGHEVGGG